MSQLIDPSFLGIGWDFPPSFTRQWYGTKMLSGEADVFSSIYIILSTIVGERVMQPTFGCNLQPHVFDVMDVANITLIHKIVFEALTYHEPRIIVGDITSEVQQNEARLLINIPFTIIRTNVRTNMVYPFYIKEATNIDHAI